MLFCVTRSIQFDSFGEAFVRPPPEANPVGDGQRRLDRAEAGDMLMAHLAAEAAGFHDGSR